MKKYDLKNFMIVRSGIDDELYLLFKSEKGGVIVRPPTDDEYDKYKECDEETENDVVWYDLDDFNDDLVYTEFVPCSIVEVYDSIPEQNNFILDVEELFNKFNPKLLWKRKPSNLSISRLENEGIEYLNSVIPPYFTVK